MFRTQAQFPRGGKIRSAGAAGKVQDQRPLKNTETMVMALDTSCGML